MLQEEKVMQPPKSDEWNGKEKESAADPIWSGMFATQNLAQGFIYSVVLGKPRAKVRGRW
jgi:hypothetical protein